jgi:uncharacterized damage-inducible protein DinB
MSDTLKMLLAYKAWANRLTFETAMAISPLEATRHRATRWESIAYTLSHVWVVDDIFRHNLEGLRHKYTFRNIEERLSVEKIWQRQQEIDAWYCDFASNLNDSQCSALIDFEFIGGGAGRMSCAEIILHIVNHGTYHRGLISDMLYQIPVMPQTNDLTVFLRDHWRSEFVKATDFSDKTSDFLTTATPG